MKLRKAKSEPQLPSAPSAPSVPIPAASPQAAALDPMPLRKALAALEKTQSGIVKFQATMIQYEKDVQWAKANLDPREIEDLRQLRFYQDRVEMAPIFLRREQEKVPGLLDALLDECRTFDHALIAAGRAECEARFQAVAGQVAEVLGPVLADHKIDRQRAAQAVAALDPGLRHVVTDPAAFQENPDTNYLHSLNAPSFFRRPEVPIMNGEATQLHLDALAQFERVLRRRVDALLKVAAVWEARGGSFIPVDPTETPMEFASTATASTAGSLPAVDLAASENKVGDGAIGGAYIRGLAAGTEGYAGGFSVKDTTAGVVDSMLPQDGPQPMVTQALLAKQAGHNPPGIANGTLGGMFNRGSVAPTGPGNIGGASPQAAAPAAPATTPDGKPAVDLEKLKL